MLWDQHRERYEIAGHTARRITYCKFTELTRHISTEDMATIGRLNAKRLSGDTLTQEETDRLTAIATKWPQDDLRGACLIPPTTGAEVRRILAELPRAQSEELERSLDACATPEIPQEDLQDPLALQLAARGGLGIDLADMTVGQGYAIIAMPTPREG